MSEFRSPREPLVQPGSIDHHVGDMTVTVAADVPLRRLQETLAGADQWLPIDGPLDQTIGRLVNTNSTGPLRLGYGAWRDLLLGAQFHNGRGELITAGGRTVKNVAGYDLTKFMVGQHGVFGTLLTLTVRTYKRPAGAVLAIFPPRPQLIERLIPSPARPHWTLLTPDGLLCGYLGDERALAYYSKSLSEPQWKAVSVEPRPLDADVEHRGRLWRGDFRASVPPARVLEFISAAKPAPWVADAAFGIVRGNGQRPAIEAAVKQVGASVVFDGDAAPAGGSAPAPESTSQRELIMRLKKAFDPDNRLAPLPWA
jgi:FAD/FMN-containing dehydrogenase